MIIDLRGRGRRIAAGLLFAGGLALAVYGAGQLAREVAAVVAPGPVPIRSVARTDRVVAVTFDAAWGTGETEAIVGALVRNRLPATFFASGFWLEQQSQLARQMAEAGFEFGNATASFPHLDALSPEAQREELRRADVLLTRLTGQKAALFRPPYGEVTVAAGLAAKELRYALVTWSIDGQDGRNPPPELLVGLIERHLAPGAIIRLSTGGRRTAEAIPLLAQVLKRHGYRALPLSRLLLRDNYYVDRATGEQRPLPGSRTGERPVLAEWWDRRRNGVRRGVTLAGRHVEGLLAVEVRWEVEELARRLNQQPRDATWDAARQTIEPETAGRRVEVDATVRAVLNAAPGTAVSPVTSLVAPRVTAVMFQPVYRGRADRPELALMFNVAWGNEVLPALLDELERAGARATFFVEGYWAERFPGLLKEIARRGHPVGSHAFHHLDFRTRPPEELAESLRRTDEVLRASAVNPAPLFAPPAGAVSPAVARTAAQAGYWTVMWTVDSVDWQRPDPSVIRARVGAKVVPGALILLHPTAPTVAALPGLISDLRRAGYSLVTVGDLLPASAGVSSSGSR